MSEDSPKLEPIAAGADYELSAALDKSVYRLAFKPDRLVVRLRGEDASRFQADHAAVVARFPNWTADQTLAQLWDQGGYGWLATEGDC